VILLQTSFIPSLGFNFGPLKADHAWTLQTNFSIKSVSNRTDLNAINDRVFCGSSCRGFAKLHGHYGAVKHRLQSVAIQPHCQVSAQFTFANTPDSGDKALGFHPHSLRDLRV
jgi:hypothetical protein